VADVFVSYARSDRELVAPLIAGLEERGLSVWWDPAIAPGQEFDRQIAAELAAAAAVLVVWTPNSVQSRWVRGEAREGADRGILVPVRFGDASLPIDFRAFQTIDLKAGDATGASPAFHEAVRALSELVDRAREPPPTAAVPGAASSAAPPAPGPARATICVLPFSSLGADPEQQAFSDGITGDIITELSRWRMLAVRSRSASFKYRGNAVDIDEVARQLDVRYVVEGSVRRIADRIRISVELIDTETGRQVWAERFDRSLTELFDVQDSVVQRIVSTLVGRVQVSDVERARRKLPASLDAYECVLKGNALPWDDPQGLAEATRLFEQAVELDPEYGLAHGMLAMMRCTQWRNDPGDSRAALDEALRLAKRAVELDDGDSTCHSLLSQIYLYQRSFERALEHMRRSVEFNPNNQWNLADMGQVIAYLGRAEEAIDWFRRAREIDPYFDPPWYWRQAGIAYLILRRFEDALSMFAHIPARTFRIAAYMAACHARLGDLDRARTLAEECLSRQPQFSVRRFVSKEPFQDRADADHLAESLRLAGLPE